MCGGGATAAGCEDAAEAIMAAFYANPEVKAAVASGIEMLPSDYIPDTSAMPLTLSNGTVSLKGFFDWVEKAAGAVVNAVKKTVSYVANAVKKHPKSAWDIGCATWDVFNFFADGDAFSCKKFVFPDMVSQQAQKQEETSAMSATAGAVTKYDPVCTSECQSCLNTPRLVTVILTASRNDYKGNWPSDLYCRRLQSCPSGTTRTLLGEATNTNAVL